MCSPWLTHRGRRREARHHESAAGAGAESVDRRARLRWPIAGVVERRDTANRPQEPSQNQSIDVLALAEQSW